MNIKLMASTHHLNEKHGKIAGPNKIVVINFNFPKNEIKKCIAVKMTIYIM